ncbi:ribonuclease HII [Lacticaseibacillus songhuajiangensis]|uniref:ribonuclease HII n=1 Tax=Lacticaseibacillus songhuajiangensis TaxID=1296539 RepID=UPI000F7B9A0A|nr:ribonuclease HII [Lacticaseibacillus songhuajiangensis]
MSTIAEVKQLLSAATVDEELITELRTDPRAGVQKLLQSYDKKQAKIRAQQHMLEEHKRLERGLWPHYDAIAGIDEVGRGPLAGPVVTAAVIITPDFDVPVNDSKQLTPHRRAELFGAIISQARAVAIGVRSSEDIDRYNIYHATELAMADAVHNLRVQPDYLLVDAMTVPVDLPQSKLIKGDARSASIGAASIVAKVVRDRLMDMYDQIYPGYDFTDNAGYGTAKHLAGMAAHGITPIHRRSFSPVQKYL